MNISLIDDLKLEVKTQQKKERKTKMPLESKWAYVSDDEEGTHIVRESPKKTKFSGSRNSNSRGNNTKSHNDKSSSMMGGHSIGFVNDSDEEDEGTEIEEKPERRRSISPKKKPTNINSHRERPTTSSGSLEGRIVPNFQDERDTRSAPSCRTSTSKEKKQPSKLELLKKKIEEQKHILQKNNEIKHKEQQKQLLEDFLNDDDGFLNWEDDEEENDKLLERLGSLEV